MNIDARPETLSRCASQTVVHFYTLLMPCHNKHQIPRECCDQALLMLVAIVFLSLQTRHWHYCL